ncbi:MAG: hypothetical protein ACFFFK_07420, partial [Candidatus Thorarchaeota archaeon]
MMQNIALFLNALQTLGLLLGILIALIQIRKIQETGKTELDTRQASLFMQIYDHFYNPKFVQQQLSVWDWRWENYDDYLKKYAFDKNTENGSLFFSVGTYFEGIGVLVYRRLIDPNIVDDLISGLVI